MCIDIKVNLLWHGKHVHDHGMIINIIWHNFWYYMSLTYMLVWNDLSWQYASTSIRLARYSFIMHAKFCHCTVVGISIVKLPSWKFQSWNYYCGISIVIVTWVPDRAYKDTIVKAIVVDIYKTTIIKSSISKNASVGKPFHVKFSTVSVSRFHLPIVGVWDVGSSLEVTPSSWFTSLNRWGEATASSFDEEMRLRKRTHEREKKEQGLSHNLHDHWTALTFFPMIIELLFCARARLHVILIRENHSKCNLSKSQFRSWRIKSTVC